MNRNVESHFALNPTSLDMNRSRFDRSSSVKTSFNVGDIVPFYVDEVLPGDTFRVKTSKVVRLQTLLTPIMDNVYLDTYYFFVPNRLVWDHWKQFNGENTESAWIPPIEYSVPQVISPADSGWPVGSIADYMGVPINVPNLPVSALPFRAYALICNEWFRDQNVMEPLVINTGDANEEGKIGEGLDRVALGGSPYKASKYHDYFTSCLPSPQKGPDVTIDIASGGWLPVVSRDTTTADALSNVPFTENGIHYKYGNNYAQSVGTNPPNATFSTLTATANPQAGDAYLRPDNLWAYSVGDTAVASINQLRLAFQIQKLYEKDARGGTRYIEVLKSHFGVTSPDARLQRPEYLGGNRVPITINQIIQQSGTGSGSSTPQGTVVGQSLTTDSNEDFTHSFVEHGFVIGVMVARYDHTYQQGLERFWSRKTRFDYYWPVLANIGEQAVLEKEIFATGEEQDDNEVFGYQEAWADYRYKPNRVSGEMRSTAPRPLDVWHLADHYDAPPHLSREWIAEDLRNVDRVLAVTSTVSNQLFADIYIQNDTTRVMPIYSIPGLIDHH